MAKAVVSSGGGGSFGKGVAWHKSLFDRLRDLSIPGDAVCAADVAAEIGKTEKAAAEKLLALVKGGEYVRAWGRKAGQKRSQFWYWPK